MKSKDYDIESGDYFWLDKDCKVGNKEDSIFKIKKEKGMWSFNFIYDELWHESYLDVFDEYEQIKVTNNKINRKLHKTWRKSKDGKYLIRNGK